MRNENFRVVSLQLRELRWIATSNSRAAVNDVILNFILNNTMAGISKFCQKNMIHFLIKSIGNTMLQNENKGHLLVGTGTSLSEALCNQFST